MPLISRLNPTVGNLGAGDLAVPFIAPSGRRGYVWGDSFEQRVFGPNWRSPVITWADETPLDKPITMTSAARGGRQLRDYVHNGMIGTTKVSTILPTDVLTVGSRLYLWVMVVGDRGLGDERWCEVWWSDDDGETWDYNGRSIDVNVAGRRRVMVTWDRGRDGWVYVFSTNGLARDRGIVMWRVREGDHEAIINARFEAWTWTGREWAWVPGGTDPGVVREGEFGELGYRWIQGHHVLGGLELTQGPELFSLIGYGPIERVDWTRAPRYVPVRGWDVGGSETLISPYGGYPHPDSRFDGPWAIIASSWHGDVYEAQQRTVPAPRPLGELIADTTPPAPPTEKDDDMADAQSVLDELTGGAVEYDVHVNRRKADGGTYRTKRIKELAHAAAFELTLWLPRRGLRNIAASRTKVDTALGHAIVSASYGEANHALLVAIAVKLGVDVPKVLAPYVDDPIVEADA
jgi:hypothetical protein